MYTMRTVCYVLVALLAVVPAWAQRSGRSGSSSLQVSSGAVEAPSSSIDLLKKSFESSSQTITGIVTHGSRKQVKKEEDSSAKQSAASSGATVQPVKSEAGSAASPAVPAVAANAVALPTGASTLDMPLEMGGTTQSVQTSITPVQGTKKLSPAAAKRVEQAKAARAKRAQTSQPTETENAIEKENTLLPPSSKEGTAAGTQAISAEEAAADAELEYAVKMMEESKEKAAASPRRILPAASENRPATVPAPNKAFNPNAYRPGVTWGMSKSTHFDIYTQKRSEGIPSSNMAMTFETAYQTLSRFIPWMMSGRVRVFVYQDRASYLRYEPNAHAWSRAVAYPTRGEVVVYDEPGKAQDLKEAFTHELTHIFTQQFFDSHKTGKMMTPLWLDEGLAVMMEDHAYNGAKGGPWANDFNTLNFQRSPASTVGGGFGSSSSMFGSSSGKRFTGGSKRRGKPLFFVPFEDFMKEDSLQVAEGRNKTQDWYFQAYAMVRFLLNPSGSSSPSNRMQFEQFTRLLSQGEVKRDPSTGFLVKDKNGKTVYEPYSVEKALGKAYHYPTASSFEDAFWRWADKR